MIMQLCFFASRYFMGFAYAMEKFHIKSVTKTQYMLHYGEEN